MQTRGLCTSLGVLLVATNSGTLIIALPDLERALGTSLLAGGLWPRTMLQNTGAAIGVSLEGELVARRKRAHELLRRSERKARA